MESIVSQQFVGTLEHFASRGSPNQRELATVALDLYRLCSHDPAVVSYVNQRALEAMNRAA